MRAALAAAEGLAATPANLRRVALLSSEEAARWAFSQGELRRRARARFGEEADEMLFDADGLAMATHPALAAYHASLFPDGALVEDLTCGIGADLRALARRGPATGYELDPDRAELARWNAPGATVVVGDGLDRSTGNMAFADPQRRAGKRRLDEPESWSPDPRLVAERFRGMERAAMKLSPGTPDDYLSSLGGRIEFVSSGGECREALVVFPADGPAEALHLESGARLPAYAPEPPRAEGPGAWLLDADPAAVRAAALGGLGLSGLGDTPGYLTADGPVESPWLRAYRVEWAGRPADAARAARTLGGRIFEVKTRGVVPVRIPKGEGRPLSLVLYREGASERALLVSTEP